MHQKLKIAILCLSLHLSASFVIWGGLKVYQRGYNTMHREQIAVASVAVSNQQASIQILQNSCHIPTDWLAKDSPLYFAAYALTGEQLHFWISVFSTVSEII